MAVPDWMLDSDPAIRWQALRDLVNAPTDVVAAQRARVATEGWGNRLLALQEDGQWDAGACFPAGWFDSAGGKPDEDQGQPWTSTPTHTLQLLLDLGVDPHDERVRRAVARRRWRGERLVGEQ